MAGAGYKAWSAGDVLTASDVNTYLMQQSVMTFAGTAARASAVAAPSEGMLSYRTDENVLEGYDGSQWVPTTALTPTSLTGRNMIYNSAMQIAQRGTSVTNITTGDYRTADRWYFDVLSLGTWTQTVEADAPTGSGFRNSLKVTCGTADASPAAGDYAYITQKLEGQDLQRIKKGTASAEKLTISFWVKSNKTGTYIAELFDLDNTRQVSASYTVSASATWEKKVITFPADATGTFDNDNAASMLVNFWLGVGTDRSSGTLNTSWASNTNANRCVGQVNVAATNANYWQVTGVQLEVGPVATPFEFESFGDTLRKCQRYYEKSYEYSTAPGTNHGSFPNDVQYALATPCYFQPDGWGCHTIRFQTEKRASPTLTVYTPSGTVGSVLLVYGTGPTANTFAPSGIYVSARGFVPYLYGYGTNGGVGKLVLHYTASSEL